jgi:hypothetical protein
VDCHVAAQHHLLLCLWCSSNGVSGRWEVGC